MDPLKIKICCESKIVHFSKIRARQSLWFFIENFPCQNQCKKFLPLKRWKPLRPNLAKPSFKVWSVFISPVLQSTFFSISLTKAGLQRHLQRQVTRIFVYIRENCVNILNRAPFIYFHYQFVWKQPKFLQICDWKFEILHVIKKSGPVNRILIRKMVKKMVVTTHFEKKNRT